MNFGTSRQRSHFSTKLAAVALTSACLVSVLSCSNDEPRVPPYPPSQHISDVTFDFDNLVRLGVGSDLWPVTWAADGNLYLSFGDGTGFGDGGNGWKSDDRASLGFSRITGGPTNFSTANIWGGKNRENPKQFDGKCAGIISVDGTLYAWINTQEGLPPDRKLSWSNDLGATWQLSDWHFPRTADFFACTFLNFGRDNAGARDNYIYSYGGEWVEGRGPVHDIMLMRVPNDQLKEPKAYEYFAGFDASGAPRWSHNVSDRKPIFTDPNGVPNAGLIHVVFNPGLGRYIMTVNHRPRNEPQKVMVGQFGIFDAPEPWGPWTTVAYIDDFNGYSTTGPFEALGFDMPTKWTSQDGKTMWLMFSGYSEEKRVLDSFNLLKMTFTTPQPVSQTHPQP